jgi:hypothetical protein
MATGKDTPPVEREHPEVRDNNHIFFSCPLTKFMWSVVRKLRCRYFADINLKSSKKPRIGHLWCRGRYLYMNMTQY